MKRIAVFSMLSLFLFVSLTAFQCSSTEMTSARLYIKQKNYDKAMEALKKEISKNPKSDEGYYFLGYLHGEKGEYKEMLENFDKSLGVSKRFAKEISDAKKSYWGSSFNKGVAFFNKAAKAQSKDSINANFDKAISSFRNAVMIEPDSADTYKNLAFALLQAGRPDEAEKPLTDLIKLKKSLDAYKLLGEIYSNKGAKLNAKYAESKDKQDSLAATEEFNKSIALLEDARKNYPDDQEVLLLLSNAYIAGNKADVAIETFKAGVEKDPNNQYYRFNYGTLLLQANKFEEAVAQLTKATEIDPKYHNAFFNLGVAYVKWGTDLRVKADEAGVDNPEYKNKYTQALPFLQKASELKSEDPAIWETLAKVYAVLGMQKESQEAFGKADQFRK
ncbi:MAG: tetratricopeptide repeat protein [Bacteroidota bacterium]